MHARSTSEMGLGCVKTQRIEKSRERSFSGKPKSVSLENVCATIDDFHRRFFCHYRARLGFYTAWVTNDRFPMSAECPLFREAEEHYAAQSEAMARKRHCRALSLAQIGDERPHAAITRFKISNQNLHRRWRRQSGRVAAKGCRNFLNELVEFGRIKRLRAG